MVYELSSNIKNASSQRVSNSQNQQAMNAKVSSFKNLRGQDTITHPEIQNALANAEDITR